MALGRVVVYQRAGNRVDDAEGVVVGGPIGFQCAAKDFDGRRLGEFVAGNRLAWKGERKLHGVTGLLCAEIGDGNWNRRRRWSGFAGRTATKENQSHAGMQGGSENVRPTSRGRESRHPVRAASEDIPAEVLVLDDVGKLLVYVGSIDLNGFFL